MAAVYRLGPHPPKENCGSRQAIAAVTPGYCTVGSAGALVAQVLAIDHYPMAPALQAQLDGINSVLSFMFLVEMILKLLGLGAKE